MELKNYTVIDIENPNHYNDSICSIGIVDVKNGEENLRKEFLVNPEADFDRKNIEKNGITELMVRNKPKIIEVWDSSLKEYFENNIIVGHNVRYDLSVIAKHLERNSIKMPEIDYVDTMVLANKYLPNVGGNSLGFLCKHFNIDIKKQHNALNDAVGCYYILKKIMEKNNLEESDIGKYNYEFGHLEDHRLYDNRVSLEINNFYGMVKGIIADKLMNEKEIREIKLWIDKINEYSNQEPFCYIVPRLINILEDETVTEEEQRTIMNMLQKFIVGNIHSNITISLQILIGIIKGICCDNELNEREINSLKLWLDDNKMLAGNYPYDKILHCVKRVLDDGKITEDEKLELYNVFKEFLDPSIREEIGEEMVFIDNVFCLTGDFCYGKKEDVGKMIENAGGVIVQNVSKKTNYLIVGGSGSKDWAYGNYGTKVKKAIEYQERGIDIKILYEEEIMKLLGD